MRFGFSLAATGLIGVAVLVISFGLAIFVRRFRQRQKEVPQRLPSFDRPSDVVQMKALMDGTAHDLVRSVLGKSHLDPGDYHAVMTVSFQTALEFVESNYTVDQLATTEELPRDGYYAVPSDGTWQVYSQEKGGRLNVLLAHSETEVFRHYVKYVLYVKQKRSASGSLETIE